MLSSGCFTANPRFFSKLSIVESSLQIKKENKKAVAWKGNQAATCMFD